MSNEQALTNHIAGLGWIHQFGWLRPQELGGLLWPNVDVATSNAENICREWLLKEYVVARTLPYSTGTAFVLSAKGATFLNQHGMYFARSNARWGNHANGNWEAPAQWRHDLLCTGYLVLLYQEGWKIFPEKQLRSENAELVKIPDGLAKKENRVLWIEAESARKTGKKMDHMALALIDVSIGAAPTVSNEIPNESVVIYPIDSRDEHGHVLRHHLRIKSAIKRHAKRDVKIAFIALLMEGWTVKAIHSQHKAQEDNRNTDDGPSDSWTADTVSSDRASYILRQWKRNFMPWRKEEIAIPWNDYFLSQECLSLHLRDATVRYWQQNDMQWYGPDNDNRVKSLPAVIGDRISPGDKGLWKWSVRFDTASPNESPRIIKGTSPDEVSALRALASLPYWDDTGAVRPEYRLPSPPSSCD